ncbi:MAG: filamentous hemagglutinin N-terminal domain-containing protein, partial [Parasphingorhabdus sp.]
MDRLRSGTAMRAVLVASLIMQPITSAYAQNAAARSSPPIVVRNGQEAILNVTPTGTPIVEVAAPDNNGTSYNVFERFNVYQEGTILNNSAEIANSLLAGQLLANPNFTSDGREADLIIAEVLGGNRSDLLGPLEVFGGEAGLILANPAGITCDGCGFVGTPRVTLSTGQVQFGADGRFNGLAVTQGDVTVSGQGLLGGNVDYFDIVSLTAKINADLYTRDLQVSAGTSDFDYAQRLSRSRGRTGTGIAIDSTLLGGMFANRIRLVGNDRGVGINLQGAVASLQDDVSIEAPGAISVASVVAAKDLDIRSRDGSVSISDRAYAAGNLGVDAAGSILTSGQFVGAGRDVSLQADAGISVSQANIYAGLNVDGTLTGAGSVVATSAGDFQLDGDVLATQRISLASQDLSTSTGSQITATNVAILAKDATVAGNISSLGDLGLTVDRISAAGNIVANGSIDIASNDAVQFSGIVASGEDLTLAIDGDADIAGIVSANESLLLDVSGNADVGGTIAANGATIFSSQYLDLGGTISGLSAVDISIAALSSDTATAQISSDGNVNLLSAGSILFDGQLFAGGNFTVDSGDAINLSGSSQSAGKTVLDAGTITLAGQVVSDDGIDVLAGKSLNVSGALQSTSDIDLNAGEAIRLLSSAQIAAGGMLAVGAGTDVGLAGRISTGETAVFVAAQSIDNAAVIGSVGGISLNSARIDSKGVINSSDLVALSADNVNVDGQLIGGTGLSVNASNITTGTDADIQSGGSLSLVAFESLSLAGLSQSAGDTKFQAGDDLLLDITSISGGNIEGQAGNQLSGSGSLTAIGNLSLNAAEIDSSFELSAVGDVLLQSSTGNLTQVGLILSETGVEIVSGGESDISGSIASAGMLALSGENLILDAELLAEGKVAGVFDGDVRLAGKIDSNDDIGFSANTINNAAALTTQGRISLTAPIRLVNEGAISALGGVNLNAGGVLIQTGEIETAGALNFTATTNVTLEGRIAASGNISASAMRISANGVLESGDNINLEASEDIEVSSAASLFARETIALNADGNLFNHGLVSGRAVNIEAVDITNSGRVESGTTTNFLASGVLSSTGEITSIGALNLIGDSLLLDGNTETGSTATANAGNSITLLGTLSAQDQVSISGGSVDLGNAASLLSDATIGLNSTGSANLAGLVGAQEDVTVAAVSIVSSGDIQSGANIVLAQSGFGLVNLLSGDLFADGAIKITGDVIEIGNTVTGLLGLDVEAESLTTGIDSLLQSGSALKLRSVGNADLDGDLLSLGALDVLGEADLAISGEWQSADRTALTATGDLMLDGSLLSSGTTGIRAASIDLSGIAQSDQAFELLGGAGGVSIAGSLSARGNIDLNTVAQIDLTGSLRSGAALDLTGENINLTGDLAAFADLAIEATNIISTNTGANIEAGGAVNITAAELQSAADILSGDQLLVDVAGSAVIGGLIQSLGALDVNAGSVDLDAELISLDNISVDANMGLSLSEQASLASGGTLTLIAGTDIANNATLNGAGGISINAIGALQSTGAIASGATIEIDAAEVTLVDVSAVGDIQVDATGALGLSGDVVSDGDINLAANDIEIAALSNVVSAGSIFGDASDSLTNAGAIAATSDITLTAGGDLNHNGSLFTEANAFLSAGNAALLNGDIEAGLTVNIDATRADLLATLTGLTGVVVIADDIFVGGLANVQSGTTLGLTANNNLLMDGSLLALGKLTLDAGNLLDFAGDAQAGGNATLSSGDVLSFTGSLISNGDVSLQASDLRLTGGTIGAGNALSVISASDLDLATNLASVADITVQSGGNLNLTGDLTSNNSVILSGNNIDIASIVSGQNRVDIDTAAALTFSNTAIIASGGLIDIDAGSSMNNAGLISAVMVDIAAADIVSAGRIESSSTVDLSASGSLANTGEIASVGALGLTGNSLSLGGIIETGSTVTLNANDTVMLTGTLSAQDNIDVSAGAVDLQGSSLLVSNADISVTSNGAVIADGTVFTPGALDIIGGTLNIGGVVQSRTRFDANVQSADISGALFSDQEITVDTGTGDIGISGAIVAGAGLNVTGTSLTTTGTAELFATGPVAITTVGAINLDGILSGENTIGIDAGTDIVLGAQIIGQDAISIQAGGSLNQNGIIETAGNLELSGLDLRVDGRLT